MVSCRKLKVFRNYISLPQRAISEENSQAALKLSYLGVSLCRDVSDAANY